MLKIEVSSYNRSALRHLGAALTAMADDIKRDCIPREELTTVVCHPAPRSFGTQAVPALPVGCRTSANVEGGNAAAPPSSYEEEYMVPVGVDPVTMRVDVPPPPAAEDDDEAWADPPGTAPADNLDADGIPWDARIHAGTKTRLKASNTWKLKPGIDKALVDQVKAELMGVQAVVAVPAPPAPTLADAAAVSAALQAPPPPPAPTGPTNFAELIKEVTSRITAGQMTPDQVNGAVATVTGGQLTMCNQLAARQDLIPAVWSVICPTVG